VDAVSSGTSWERLFWFVFNNSTNPMALIDENRRVVEVNDPSTDLWRRSRMEVLGHPADDFLAPSDRPEAQRRWQSILRNDSAEYHGIGTVLRGDGSELTLEFAARMVRIGGRRLAIYVLSPPTNAPGAWKGNGAPKRSLTQREREVVTAIAMGRETPQIAEELHISPATVRTHVRNAMSKLEARTRAQLVAQALSENEVLHLPQMED
jgi:PAS domain S-box-containing protein